MLTARKFAQEVGVDYSTVVRWLKLELVPGAERKESEDRGAWWEIPETSLNMEKPKSGPKPKRPADQAAAPPADEVQASAPSKPTKKLKGKGAKKK